MGSYWYSALLPVLIAMTGLFVLYYWSPTPLGSAHLEANHLKELEALAAKIRTGAIPHNKNTQRASWAAIHAIEALRDALIAEHKAGNAITITPLQKYESS